MNNSIQFDDSISFAKGVGIVLMVLGHTFFSAYGYTVIYMFHMPLFFFISGYCFRTSHLENFRNYAKKRIGRIYVPYVKWGLIFLILHNIFFHLNIYNDTFGFDGEVSQLYGMSDYLKKTFLIIFSLTGNEQLLGGYWFLHTLFFASFVFYGLIKLKKPIVWGGGSLLISVLLIYYGLPHKEFLAVSFMIAGYIYKYYLIDKYVDKYTEIIILLCLFLLILGSVFWSGSMLHLKWFNATPYFISAISGSIIILKVSKSLAKINNLIQKCIVDIGNRTLIILTWHFLCFKITSLIIIAYYGLPIEHLAEFPVMKPYHIQGWWICYFVIGVAAPVIGTVYINKLSNFISSKYHSLCR